MADESSEKKHNATSYRRQKAREQGKFARSDELTSATIFLTSVLALQFIAPRILAVWQEIFLEQFAFRSELAFGPVELTERAWQAIAMGVWSVLPLLIVSLTVAMLAHLGQTGFVIPTVRAGLDWDRINLAKGFQRLVAMDNASRWGIGLVRLIAIVTVLFVSAWRNWEQIANLGELELAQAAGLAWQIILDVLLKAALCMLAFGVCDYGYQRWKFEQQIRMTDDEMREEIKATQGDQSAKARRRAIHREWREKRSPDRLPNCDMVLVDSSRRLAIAIQCDPSQVTEPRIVAMGSHTNALRLQSLAEQQSIPVRVSDDLTRRIADEFTEGQVLNSNFYLDVATAYRRVLQEASSSGNPETRSSNRASLVA